MLEFPVDKIKSALFVGEEQEGPNQGKKTLFVVGDVKYEYISTFIREMRIKNIYFGAGGRFGYNVETIKKAAIEFGMIETITVEDPNYNNSLHRMINFEYAADMYWVVPYVWDGKPLGAIAVVANLIAVTQKISKYETIMARILIKTDINKHVFISRLKDVYVNSYSEGYDKDQMLYAEYAEGQWKLI